ncbi:hypothetical protein RDB90_003219 [Salmonella enterica]|nr:hypothetical protein [Salmonella enterica]MCB2250094.1 hypothetical protein [Salmonella enterica subsp. diarizonae]
MAAMLAIFLIASPASALISSTRFRALRELSKGFISPSLWHRVISPRIALTIKPALLSPSHLINAIPSITSSGMRTVVICDFEFL